MAPTLYVKYGSRLTSGMAECFYDRVLVDPDLAPFFEGIDIETLREQSGDNQRARKFPRRISTG